MEKPSSIPEKENIRERHHCGLCDKELFKGDKVFPSLEYENLYYHEACASNKLKELYNDIEVANQNVLLSHIRKTTELAGAVFTEKVSFEVSKEEKS